MPSDNPPQQTLELAIQHHQAARLPQAEAIYRQILARDPQAADAMHLLGVIAHQTGHGEPAVELMTRAIALRPNFPEAMSNLAVTLMEMGRLDHAIGYFRRAIALRTGYAEAHANLGKALKQAGRVDEAIECYRRAISLNPNLPETYGNLGNAMRDKGQVEESIFYYRKAIALRPDFPVAHNNLGNALRDKGQLDEATACYRQAVALKPDYSAAHNNLGNALRDKGELEQAIACYRTAISFSPKLASMHGNLGAALREQGHIDEAIACFRRALVLEPDSAEILGNLADVLLGINLDEALACGQRAVVLKPDYPEAYNSLGNALMNKGQLAEAIACFRKAVALKPAFSAAYSNLSNALKDVGQMAESIESDRRAVALKPDCPKAHSNLVLGLHYAPESTPKSLFEECRRWAMRFADPLKGEIRAHGNDRDPSRRLKIGYVSPDLREHVVGRFLLPLLAHHDSAAFEIFCYARVPVPDAVTERLRSHSDHWRSIIGLSDAKIADLIRRDGIDILIDLGLHSADSSVTVFARKPAPVQAIYLAYCSTSGMDTIDYRITDPYLDPPGGGDEYYSEKSIHLPETYWCYEPVPAPESNPLPAMQAGHITFGCLNNFCKISPSTLDTWCQLLHALPNSRLILHCDAGSHRHLTDRLTQQNIDPNRVRLVGRVAISDYFALYQSIDIALDPFPYTGGTTTCDALWMGVPVITLAGQTAVSRGGSSLLSNVGLPELVTLSRSEYLRTAIELANDLSRLADLRSTLRPRMRVSPLMDAPRFAGNMEAAYRRMWQAWCASPAPQSEL